MSWWRAWRELPAVVGAGFARALAILEQVLVLLLRDDPPRPAFVCVIIVAQTAREFGEARSIEVKSCPIVLTESKRLSEKSETITHQLQMPISKGTVTVLCDLMEVEVVSIFAGVFLLGAGPIALFDRVLEPGVIIRVQLRRVTP
jgi:hypothetical protein